MVCIESNNLTLCNNLSISSVIYSIYIKDTIDINNVSHIFKESKIYDGNKLTFKMNHPKSTICMTQSGYMRSMGAKSINNAIESINKTLNKLMDNDLISKNVIINKKGIENIVASGTITENTSDLEELSYFLDNIIYEPEQFPGLIYRPEKKIVVLLFSSGKIVIVGAKSIDDINTTYYNLKEKLKQLE